MPVQSKCQQYSPSEIDLESISNLAFDELDQHPFKWQLEATAAILSGNDVVLDVGTGCGKSLCFSLPLLFSKSDISLTVSPLTALMIDQVSTKYYNNSHVPHLIPSQG
jgi:superfamily II DNA helicase RecQ